MITTIGEVSLLLTKGYCPVRKKWITPVREVFQMEKNQRLSPSLQRKLCCTAAATGAFEKASAIASEWGCEISDDAIRNCVLSVGDKANRTPLETPCAERAGKDDVLVIMMDGWMARHRGKDWGKKKHRNGDERVQWHEIKSAVIYRLGDRVEISPQRHALISKHIVATPSNTDPTTFGQRVQHEALRMGLAQARSVYVVMDGAIWLWNIFEDRFKQCATGTLDFFHASEHLHALADELFPDDKGEAVVWCKRILKSLKKYSPKKLFRTLEELTKNPPKHDDATIKAIQKADTYFQKHRKHMNYSDAAKSGLPIGSGSMESQCSQFQNRFKRTGQFWSRDGFAALLEIAVRYQNGEIRSLWAA
ncbi:MAG: hypothetical protein RBT40_11825 [Petrimonas sp.]|nr:hypothetical protein [Petrimonas sp.]